MVGTEIRRPTERVVEFVDGYIIHPDAYYSPSYRISPLVTGDVAKNFGYRDSQEFSKYFSKRFSERPWQFTHTGKEAISIAVQQLNVKRGDCITIYTTTQNRYISGCVTREIEKYCGWSREMTDKTVAIFVNHEFGFPYRDMKYLKSFGLPIIEDACHSFLADNPDCEMGSGDFILFSLPKVFPMQMGGLLSFNSKYSLDKTVAPGSDLENYLRRVTSAHTPQLASVAQIRRKNFQYLAEVFSKMDCKPRFELLPLDVPGVFMFVPPANIDLAKMKEFGWAHGIECSIFYGEHAFFIPCHQNLTTVDMNYFATVFKYFFDQESRA